MIARRRKKGSTFLAGYTEDDGYLLTPDTSAGRAGMFLATSPDGEPVLVKFWPKKASVPDIEEIWRYELRQLHRLAGYPGAGNYIAGLYNAGFDDNGFYLILAPGQRQPLAVTLERANAGHWLKLPRHQASRILMWRNLSRIAHGIGLLHAQGMLHRNIDTWAILTAAGDHPDFQLTGFEFSMRLVAAQGTAQNTKNNRKKQAVTFDSFSRDWSMFGAMAAGLLGATPERLDNLGITLGEVTAHLTIEETDLLRKLVRAEHQTRLDSEEVERWISEMLSKLVANAADKEAQFYLVFALGQTSSLSSLIREKSLHEIEIDDMAGQLSFIEDDLSQVPLAVKVKSIEDRDGERLALRGQHLTYYLREYRPKNSQGGTWELAYCDSARGIAPAATDIIMQITTDAASLGMMTVQDAGARYPRLRGKLRSWTEMQNRLRAEAPTLTVLGKVHRALVLTQFLEALYAAADAFPVEVVAPSADYPLDNLGVGEYLLLLQPRRDEERDTLSRHLNIKPPGPRLRETLTGDKNESEEWTLTESGSLGERQPEDTVWRFQTILPRPAMPDIYVFSGPTVAPQIRRGFLVSGESVGRDTQFRRRLKALKALSEHDELLRMFADRRSRVLDSHDHVIEDDAFHELDESKQISLRNVIQTIPFYMVQGPPGVGKTRLVRDLVARRFKEEPTARMLLTAQSNSAIDHLLSELEETLSTNSLSSSLVVRCRSRDSAEISSPFEIREQSQKVLSGLIGSKLAEETTDRLKEMLRQAAASDSPKTSSTRNRSRSRRGVPADRGPAEVLLRSLDGMVARAANIVFATTNSGELERLIEERGQFDWSIVEEAGKATGSELVSPLLLSHRRLLIGDHKQLPPFNSKRMIALLSHPGDVKAAIQVGEEFVGRAMRDATTDEVVDEVEAETDDGHLPELCATAISMLMFFETAIETEFQRQAKARPGKPIANTLTQQHRMHPAIGCMVSTCFYEGKLQTHLKCVQRFATELRPFGSRNPQKLPDAPVTVIDMPAFHATVGQTSGDMMPRWTNPTEVLAVKEVLKLLRANPDAAKPPTLAVLSPYARQVKQLTAMIAEGASSELSHLEGFRPASPGGFCGTVDSFQGDEADIVIISMVRNNDHSNPQNALGFLTEIQRMNVLLSRAKWQLVIVGSIKFLETIVAAAKQPADAELLRFMKTLTEWLVKPPPEHAAAVKFVPFAKLSGDHV